MNSLRYRAERKKLAMLDCVVVSPEKQAPQAVGILCHGFGASGEDLVGLAPDLLEACTSNEPVQLVFPAGLLSLADEGYAEGRAWWRLSIQRLMAVMEQGQYELIREESPPGIDDARQALCGVVEQVLDQTGLGYDRLLLGGFSQGAMLTMECVCCGLTQPPAALALYSGCLIRELQWKVGAAKLKESRIVQSHGAQDPILPLRTGQWLRDLLLESGCKVEFLQFQGPHTIPWEAIESTARLLDELVSD